MLIKFAVKNFRGFSERIEWNLGNPNNYEFNQFAVKDGVIKNGIVYGPNGAGKSNFGLAIFDIVNHLTQKMKMQDYYENFAFSGNIDSPVKFDYTFRFGKDVVEYSYSKDKSGKLLSETVKLNDKTLLFRNEASIEIQGFQVDERIKKLFLQNVNNASIINFILSAYPLQETMYLVRMQKFVDSMLWYKCLDRREFIGLESSGSNIEEYIIKNGLVDDYAQFLLDVSGQDFKFLQPQEYDKMLWCDINGGRVPFQLICSTGTNALELLFYWMQKIKQATFVFIDEFDAFYHYDLSFKVCKQLFNLSPQLFVSTHNTYLMTNDLLRPDCNFILNENKIKSLSDCTDKELRFGHNIEKLYRGNIFKV